MASYYKLKFTPESLEDIITAAKYYEDCKVGLGKRFRSEIKRKLTLLKQAPLIYSLRYQNVRFSLIEVFPYSIHFTIQETEKIIQVNAILSQYRDPDKYWKEYN